MSEEVFKALANEGLELPGRIQSQRTLRAIESVFTEWQSQSGLALNHISEVLALSVESLGAPTVSETQHHYMPSFPMGKAWTTSPALSGRKT